MITQTDRDEPYKKLLNRVEKAKSSPPSCEGSSSDSASYHVERPFVIKIEDSFVFNTKLPQFDGEKRNLAVGEDLKKA